MKEILLKVKNLKKYYNKVKAVDDISFEVRYKEVFAFLGPNGAGKTTTLEIIEGLKDKTGGEIYYFGKKVEKIGPEIKERIGVLLQNTRLIDNLTVRETFSLFSSFYTNKVSIGSLLDLVSIREKERSLIKSLSGGQRQRVALGLALVNDPDIVFLDEPTTGLDPQARHNVWSIVENLKEKGKTIFLTTHYMEEAERLADYIYIIDHGHIIANGTPSELISMLGEKSIVRFKLSENNLKIPFENANYKSNVWEIETENVPYVMETLFSWAKKVKVDIEDVSIRKPNLEDLFLYLTGRSLRD